MKRFDTDATFERMGRTKKWKYADEQKLIGNRKRNKPHRKHKRSEHELYVPASASQSY